MNNCKCITRWFTTAILLVFLLALSSTAVAMPTAATAPTEGSLTINYTYEDENGNIHVLKEVDFDLYHVANANADGTLTNTAAFAEIPLSNDLFHNQDLLIATRNVLTQFVGSNPLIPDYHMRTDAQGTAVVDVPFGLYYINAHLFWDDDVTDETVDAYYSEPFLVLIGDYDEDRGEYIYHYTAVPKISVVALTPDLDITVKKVWKNTEFTTIPKEIEVALYCDGCPNTMKSVVTLNAANNWSYTWKKLDPNRKWAVCEVNELEDYTVEYETQIKDETYTFVITNTFTGNPDPTPTPKPTPSTTPNPSVTPPPPVTTPNITIILPQTGSNLPYVPMFAGLGLVLLLAGALLQKGGERK